jgi:tetratricopeptide (TPR) repeat protein
MKKIFFAVLLVSFFWTLWHSADAQVNDENSNIIAARKARDRALVKELQDIAAKAKKEADQTKSFDAYLRLALFQSWLCEAIESHQDNKLFKQAAEEGVAAAEKAVELNPKSSEAQQLLGDLLNQLIPHVFGGGMKYGTRATDAMDKAIELNPKNVDAYVSRSISYYYTPDAFGGDKAKAVEMLEKAVKIDAKADSPHIWLALFYMDANKKKEALSEITLARKLNPERMFIKYVYDQVAGIKTNETVEKDGSVKKTPVKNRRSRKPGGNKR